MAVNFIENARRITQGPFRFIDYNTLTDLDHEEQHHNLFHLYSELKKNWRGQASVFAPFRMYSGELGINNHSKNELIQPPIYGHVLTLSQENLVRITVGDLPEVVVPRLTSSNPNGLVSVSARPTTGDVFTFNISFKPTRKKAFDRNLVWVETGEKPKFTFGIDTNNLSVAELIVNHIRAYNAALRKFQEILEYKPKI